MTPNVVAVAGIDGLPSEHSPQRKIEQGASKMFSTNGYGAVDQATISRGAQGAAAVFGLTKEKVARASACKKAGGTTKWNFDKKDYDLTGCPDVSGEAGWWSQQSTGVKAGVVIAGLGVLGAIGYFVYASQKPASYAANRRRRRRARKH